MIRSTGTIKSLPYIRVEKVFRYNKLMQGKWMAGWVDRSTGRQVSGKGRINQILFNDSHFCLFVDV